MFCFGVEIAVSCVLFCFQSCVVLCLVVFAVCDVVLPFVIKNCKHLTHFFQLDQILSQFACKSYVKTSPNLTIFASPLKKTFVVHPKGKSSSPDAQIFHQSQIVHLLNAGKYFR